MRNAPNYDVIIVGAGMAGLYSAYRFLNDGFRVKVIEAGGGVGGTWYWNRYPGARCDIPCIDYSFSFSPELQNEWTWTERYATQSELEQYFNYVADRFDLRKHIDFSTEVKKATFSESEAEWTLATNQRDYRARFLIMATGPLSKINYPDIPGLEEFEGSILHSAQWPRNGVDMKSQSVGIIGTGSTGIQMIPYVAKQADRLFVFQRTPNYIVPARNYEITEDHMEKIRANYPDRRKLYRKTKGGLPPIAPPISEFSAMDVQPFQREAVYEYMWQHGSGLQFRSAFSDIMTNEESNETAADFVRRKIHKTVSDPRVAEILSPADHPYGAKRPPVGIGYYETFNLPHVYLVDVKNQPITRINAAGVSVGASTYEFDTLILATGFDAGTGALTRLDITGPNGTTVAEKWKNGAHSFLGMALSGFPNLFIVNGPGGPGTFTNNVALTEQNVEWIANLLRHARSHNRTRIEVSENAEKEWSKTIQDTVSKTLYMRANSWYLGANIPGKPRLFIFYTGGFDEYCNICQRVSDDDYNAFHIC